MTDNIQRPRANQGLGPAFMGPVFWFGVTGAVLLWALDAASAGGGSTFFGSLISPIESLHRVPTALILIGFGAFAQTRLNRDQGRTSVDEELLIGQRTVLENVPIAFLHVRGGEIVRINEHFEKILGWTPEDCLGRTTEMLYPDHEAYKEGQRRGGDLLDGKIGGFITLDFVHKNGSLIPVRLRGGWTDPKSPEQGAIWLASDISVESRTESERDRLADDLAVTVRRLTETQCMARLGNWEYEPSTGAVWWSDQVYDVFGLVPGEVTPHLDWVLEHCHPDDRERTRAALQRAAAGKDYEIEHRFTRADGREVVVHAFGRPELNPDGEITKIKGSVQDVTDTARAVAALRKSETRLEAAQRLASLASWDYDVEADRVWWSDETYRHLGLEPQSWLATVDKYMEFVHPDDRDFVLENMAASVEHGAPMAYDHRVIRPSGEERFIHQRAVPELGPDGNVIRLSGASLDVTDRVLVEQELERSKVRLQETETLSHVGGWVWNTVTDEGVWSDETYRIHGAEPQSFDSSYGAFMDFVHPEDRERVDKEFRENLDLASPRRIDYRITRKSGEVRHIESLSHAILDDAGKAATVVGSIQDVTDRTQDEEALRQAREGLEKQVRERTRELRTTLDTVVDGVITIDHRGRIEAFSRSAEFMFGYRASEMIGENVKALMTGPDQKDHDRHLSQYMKTGKSGIIGVGREVVGRHKDGSEFPIHLSIGEMTIGGQQKYVGTVQDVSARKEAEEELRERDERLVAISQMSPVGLVRTARDGAVTYGNDTFYQIMGRSPEEVAGAGWASCLHGDDRDRTAKEWKEHADAGQLYRCEYRVVQPDGRVIWVQGETKPVYDDAGAVSGHIGTLTDITVRKQVAAALEQSEARFRAIIENSTDVVVILDDNARYKYVSPPGMRLTELETESLDGFSALDFILPEDAEVFMDAFRTAQGSPGETIFVPEYRVEVGAGDIVFLEALLTALPGLAGVDGVVVNAREITERVIAERENLRNKELAEAASNAKSDFLSSMSHELRTPMNAILGFSQLLDIDTKNPLSEEQHSFVREILQSGRHMMELIGDVLDLAKIESGNVTLKIEDRQPRPLIDMCLTMIRAAADKDGISVTSNLAAAEMPKLRIDPLRFKQAMLNLLSNAVKYNRSDGSVVLDSCAGENGMMRISVTDTGEGIPEELTDQVFEPFERLGAQNSGIQGTGIGLTVTKQMIEDMGGAIGFESNVGKGTTFWIDLPVAHPELH
jgi:PAS domain S-box-containing protein